MFLSEWIFRVIMRIIWRVRPIFSFHFFILFKSKFSNHSSNSLSSILCSKTSIIVRGKILNEPVLNIFFFMTVPFISMHFLNFWMYDFTVFFNVDILGRHTSMNWQLYSLPFIGRFSFCIFYKFRSLRCYRIKSDFYCEKLEKYYCL